MLVKIYCLYDPISCKIRYIGRTTKKILENRLIEHISKSKYFNKYFPSKNFPHKVNWINSLLKQGIKPGIKYLTSIEGWEKSHKFERDLINKYKNKLDLTNADDRGEGGKNKIVSIKDREKISKTLKDYYKNNINGKAKEIEVFDLAGNFIETFPSITHCAKILNINETSINSCLKGKYKQIKKYQVRYKGDMKDMTSYIKTKKPTLSYPKIEVYDLLTNTKKIFLNMTTVNNFLGVKNIVANIIKNNSDKPYKNRYFFKKIV